ncbi:MAG TPA: heme-binding protein [Acidiferrobacterales bacterium]|nr:heme-binding protein [Acidiferrobacterales bacterium]
MLLKSIAQAAVAAILAVFAWGAAAQTPAPPAPGPIFYGAPISLDNAKKAAAVASAEARKNHWAMALAVTDPAGDLVYFEKIDGTQTASVNIAIAKSRSAAIFKRATKVMFDDLASGGGGLRFLALEGAVPVEGGVPIVMDGKIVGAIGASGGTGQQDGITAKAGAEALK